VSTDLQGNVAMNEGVQFENPIQDLLISEFNRSEQQQQFENHVQSRLNDLSVAVIGLVDAPYPSLLRERDALRPKLDELVVQEAALSWIVRVTKGTEGAVREGLWLDIEKALGGLERTAEELMHAGCIG
jgi:hypothetical protein